MRFDRDSALPFQVHRIEQLILLFALVDRARALKQPIRQRRFAVIDVRDDAEIARELNCHESAHYASAPLSGQSGRRHSSRKRAAGLPINQGAHFLDERF